MEERDLDQCPECGSYNVEFLDNWDGDDGVTVKNRMTCPDCGIFYYDVFDNSYDMNYVNWELV